MSEPSTPITLTPLGWIAAWSAGERLDDNPFAESDTDSADPLCLSSADVPVDKRTVRHLLRGLEKRFPATPSDSNWLPPV